MSKKAALKITRSFIVIAIAVGLAGCASSSSGEKRISSMELLLTKQKIVSVSASGDEFHVRLNGEDRDRLFVASSDIERDNLIRGLERKDVPIQFLAPSKPSPLVLYGVPVCVVLVIGGSAFYFRRRLQEQKGKS